VLDETRHHDIGIYKRLRGCITDPAKSFVVFSNEVGAAALLSLSGDLISAHLCGAVWRVV
jgi:hypothetical protein